MRRLLAFSILGLLLLSATLSLADDKSAPAESVTSCNMDNGDQIAIRYLPVTAKDKREGFGTSVRYGTIWAPHDQAMVLFASGPLSVENHNLGAGAYTLYLMPEKANWTLIISSETDTKAKYNASKDVARVSMDVGDLPSPNPEFNVFLGHTAPNQCSLRIYWQDKGAFATFEGK